MTLILGLVLTVAGWALMLGGLLDADRAGLTFAQVQAMVGLAVGQLGSAMLVTGIVLRTLDRQVRDNFEKLFVFLAEVPASRRAMDLFDPSDAPALPQRGIRTLRHRAAVA